MEVDSVGNGATVAKMQHPTYDPWMAKTHPKKEVADALEYAKEKGMRVHPSRSRAGHAWGWIYCPEASREGCRIPVWSTPGNPGNHAKGIKAAVDSCPHTNDGEA